MADTPDIDAVVEEAFVYLWSRDATRLRFLQYSRWRATLRWHFKTLDNEILRKVFHKLLSLIHI